jgi:hypothetical protein
MCKYIYKFWINVGILLFLAVTNSQAITLTYQGVDTQNKTLVASVGCISDSVMHQTRNVILNDVFYMDEFGV